MKKSRFAIMGTEIVPTARAVIDVRSQAFNYGASVFEGIRGYVSRDGDDVRIFRLEDHLNRLRKSAAVLGMSLPLATEALKDIICELVRRNDYMEDIYIRPVAFKGIPATLGVSLHDAPDEFTVYMFPIGDYLPKDRPLRVCTSSWQRIADVAVPARCKIGGSYINPALAKSETVARGFDECIMLNADGLVAEGTTANIFVAHNACLYTPPATADILIGITRHAVMQLAREELRIETVERSIARSEVYQADEVFLCGTGAEITSVGEVDGRPIGSGKLGKITHDLQELYADVVRGGVRKYRAWSQSVYDT